MYLLRVPKLLQRKAPKGIWEMPPGIQLSVYLTFDDGPHPEITPFVLEQLAKYQAKATFFCVGDNVMKYPDVYQQILAGGHKTGNHTQNHLNGWKVNVNKYVENVTAAKQYIQSDLFRPPYGRIRPGQGKALAESGMQVVYWSLLSGDFDTDLSPEHCLKNVTKHVKPGDIVVFHDSEKAWERLQFVLPCVLEFCRKKDWQLKTL